VWPPDPLPNEEEAAPATDLPTAEAAHAGSSAVVAPAGSAAERPPDPPPDLLTGGRVRRASRLGCLHTSPRHRSSLRGREVASGGGRGGAASGGAVLRVAAAMGEHVGEVGSAGSRWCGGCAGGI
jgi:hypothetical protein